MISYLVIYTMTKNTAHIKKALQEALHAKMEVQMASLRKAISSIEESKLNETKSSAGDKFETGRAMMQMEQDKTESQLAVLNVTKNQLKQISPDLDCQAGMLGAIVTTDADSYYISVSLGKVVVDDHTYYAVSPAAPLSKLLMGCRVGDVVRFRDREVRILGIE